MNEGWIKLHRKILDSSVFDDPVTLKIWIWLLINATHKPRKIMDGLKEVILNPGDVVIAYRETAKRLKISKDALYRRITFLQKAQKVRRKARRGFTVISIINWGIYQDSNFNSETQSKTHARRTRDENKKLRMKEEKHKYYCPPGLDEDLRVQIPEDKVPRLIEYCGGKAILDALIEDLNDYIISQPRRASKYKNHPAVIRNWYRRKKDKDELPKELMGPLDDLN